VARPRLRDVTGEMALLPTNYPASISRPLRARVRPDDRNVRGLIDMRTHPRWLQTTSFRGEIEEATILEHNPEAVWER